PDVSSTKASLTTHSNPWRLFSRFMRKRSPSDQRILVGSTCDQPTASSPSSTSIFRGSPL
ncbi:hypothetical protein E4U51_008133, partial [Claviceps purpurea]